MVKDNLNASVPSYDVETKFLQALLKVAHALFVPIKERRADERIYADAATKRACVKNKQTYPLLYI